MLKMYISDERDPKTNHLIHDAPNGPEIESIESIYSCMGDTCLSFHHDYIAEYVHKITGWPHTNGKDCLLTMTFDPETNFLTLNEKVYGFWEITDD